MMTVQGFCYQLDQPMMTGKYHLKREMKQLKKMLTGLSVN